MFVVLIYENGDGVDDSRIVSEVRGPFSSMDRANQYIRNRLPDVLAEHAQSWKVDQI